MTRKLPAALAGILLGIFLAQGARAEGPRSAAGECRVLSEVYQPDRLWWGRFSGGRKARHSFVDGGVEYHTAELCFVQREACEAWLYRLKSNWQFMPRWSECRKGYQRK